MNKPLKRIVDKNGKVSYLNTDQSAPNRKDRRSMLFPKRAIRAATAALCSSRGVYVKHWQLAPPTERNPRFRMIPHIQYLHVASK